MSGINLRKVSLGLLLLGVSTALLFGPGTLRAALPATLIATAALALAVAALLVGNDGDGRPV